MFNDVLERSLLEQHTRAESLQAWAQRMRSESQRDTPSLRRRALLWMGRGLIATGSKLMVRFGAPEERRYIAPRDRAYTP